MYDAASEPKGADQSRAVRQRADRELPTHRGSEEPDVLRSEAALEQSPVHGARHVAALMDAFAYACGFVIALSRN